MKEILELQKKREEEEKAEAEAAAATLKAEQEARAARKQKFKAAANTVIAGNSLLAKIKTQAEKEVQKQKNMDFMIAKLKGKVQADKQAMLGKLQNLGGTKSGKSPSGSPSKH